jgi:hypothetical protein
MRTEGVIVEALLGQGDALDGYATRLQELEVGRREADVAYERAKAARAELLNRVVDEGDAEKARLLADLTCPCGADPVIVLKRGLGSGSTPAEPGEDA